MMVLIGGIALHLQAWLERSVEAMAQQVGIDIAVPGSGVHS